VSDEAPILVEVLRGSTVESRHRGCYAIVDAAGRLSAAAGDIERPVFPRSAIKPLQALPLIETGAADALGLGNDELALACASHQGEPVHVEKVRIFLAKAGLTVADLECGAHRPTNRAAAEALVRTGEAPSALHNNCSGKHAGFLATARHMDEPSAGYINRDHPVQQRVAAAIGEMMEYDVLAAAWGVDGCGIPSFAVPARALALGMARLADPSALTPSRRSAAVRIMAAMAAEPLLVDGSGGLTTEVMRVAAPTVRLKPGAEAVFCAALPTLGLGVALKIDDGGMRAAQVAIMALLDRLGCFDPDQRRQLEKHLHPGVKNIVGLRVGEIRPTAALLDFTTPHVV
jgi:L-asparaginase II